jgi:hypothetical protein
MALLCASESQSKSAWLKVVGESGAKGPDSKNNGKRKKTMEPVPGAVVRMKERQRRDAVVKRQNKKSRGERAGRGLFILNVSVLPGWSLNDWTAAPDRPGERTHVSNATACTASSRPKGPNEPSRPK